MYERYSSINQTKTKKQEKKLITSNVSHVQNTMSKISTIVNICYKKNYVCNIRGKHFLTKGGLSGHNWAVHNTVESTCTVCDKIFKNKN